MLRLPILTDMMPPPQQLLCPSAEGVFSDKKPKGVDHTKSVFRRQQNVARLDFTASQKVRNPHVAAY
jgi:hypothetical protein